MVRCVGIEYRDFPTVEWTLYFKNTGVKDTPILENIQALDIRVERKAGPSSDATEFHLHHQRGSPNTPQDYEPFDTVLGPEMQRRIAAAGGHPTRTDLPYFNLELPGGEGLIVVVSWAGQWAATFQRDKENHLQIRAGQELTHFKLLPGEEVRSPLIVLQFWKGDRIGSQNTWRKWMLAHNVPRPGGKPLAPMISAGNGIQYPGIITNAAEELHFLRRYLEEGIKPDYWWQDAGWYPCDPVGWPKTGTWEVEPKRWPKGIRQVSDWCRSQGMKTIVWFEPERVYSGTWLAENHPEWIHGGKGGGLLKLGDPQCRAWLVDHIDKLLVEQGIELYRQDFNVYPLPYSRSRRRPGPSRDHRDPPRGRLLRLLGRAAPASSGHAYRLVLRRRRAKRPGNASPRGAALAERLHFRAGGRPGTHLRHCLLDAVLRRGIMTVDPYMIRSQMSPAFTMCVDTRRKDLDYDLLRKLVREVATGRPLLSRRLLSADALRPDGQYLDGLAVRPAGQGRGPGAGLPPRQVRPGVDSGQAPAAWSRTPATRSRTWMLPARRK